MENVFAQKGLDIYFFKELVPTTTMALRMV
nr:MAG TPA: hypothetical protein [Caudoviricetes sp.]